MVMTSSSVWRYSAAGGDSDWTKSASDKSSGLCPSQFMQAPSSSGAELSMGGLDWRPLTSGQDSLVISLPDDLKSVLDRLGLGRYHQLFQVIIILYY